MIRPSARPMNETEADNEDRRVYERSQSRLFQMVKQLQDLQDTKPFDILPPSKKRHVVELSVQRSGSTFLMSSLAMLNNFFVLPEPYNMFDVNVTLPIFMNKHAHVPTIDSLLDCSFVGGNAVRNVFWDFACNHIPWIMRETQSQMECLYGALPLQLIKSKCREADLNLLKVLRLPLLVDTFGLDNIIAQDVKVINLVRAPWSIFMSQLTAGWFNDPQLPYSRMVPEGDDTMWFHMDRICKHMLLNHNVTLSRPHHNQLTVRYEDFTSDFHHQWRRVIDFLEIEFAGSIDDVFKSAKSMQEVNYAMFAGLNPQSIQIEVQEAEAIARQLDSCKQVIHQFEY